MNSFSAVLVYSIMNTFLIFLRESMKRRVLFLFFKSSIHPCLCIFTTNLLKHNLSLVQVAVLIAMFILSLAVGFGLPKLFGRV